MSPQCAVCKIGATEGLSFPFYLGKVLTKTETPIIEYGSVKGAEIAYKARIDPVPENVFICYPCLLRPALKWITIATICAFLLIPTIIFAIPGILGAIYCINEANKRKKAIAGNDSELRSAYLLKEKKALDAYGERIARKIMKSEVKASGQKYDIFLTPEQYAAWKPVPWP